MTTSGRSSTSLSTHLRCSGGLSSRCRSARSALARISAYYRRICATSSASGLTSRSRVRRNGKLQFGGLNNAFCRTCDRREAHVRRALPSRSSWHDRCNRMAPRGRGASRNSMQPNLALLGNFTRSTSESRAFHALGAASSAEAIRAARHVLDDAPGCGCCISHRVHLTRYVGSTLFLDDDPRQLAQAVPPRERTVWTERLFAACIVLYGRTRVTRS
jgi:hypothetical protein